MKSHKRRIVFKVTEAEYRKLEIACRKAKLTVANYFRQGLGFPLEEQGYKIGKQSQEASQ